MIRVEAIHADRRDALAAVMQKYLYEMTRYYPIPMAEDGNYRYKYLPLYFTDRTRQAYFFYDGEQMVGFALINAHSFTAEPTDNAIAEFAVFPAYRRRGYGMQAVAALRKMRPGPWQLKYSPRNTAGAQFWQRVKEKYGGAEQPLPGGDIAVTLP